MSTLKTNEIQANTSNTVVITNGEVSLAGVSSGWVNANETWTYESASTFSVAADVTGKYDVGDKIMWTQTTVKYGYIVAIGAYSGGKTIMTIAVNTDYTIANAVISANYYSKQNTPHLFPHWFNYTPTVTSYTGTFTTVSGTGKYFITGRTMHLVAVVTVTTLGTAGGFVKITLPFTVPAANWTGAGWTFGNVAVIGGYSTTSLFAVTGYAGGFPALSDASGLIVTISSIYV
ncbi:MAG TPA: hypothetical protein P5136_02345 [Methanofastidiosum sp.]|nr:hypothetical protein [Methanofastidiosum sp.]